MYQDEANDTRVTSFGWMTVLQRRIEFFLNQNTSQKHAKFSFVTTIFKYKWERKFNYMEAKNYKNRKPNNHAAITDDSALRKRNIKLWIDSNKKINKNELNDFRT